MVNQHLFPAKYWRQTRQGMQCLLCPRTCRIKSGETGYCQARINQQGKLYSLIYQQVGAIMVSVIEKKPLFHFHPGSCWLSLGTYGCNFRCPGCQNYHLAHRKISQEKARRITAQELILLAKKHNCLGLSFTYNEPGIWIEYILEAGELAQSQGLLVNLVSNGFISSPARDELFEFIDAYRVDLKGYFVRTYEKIAGVSQPKIIRNNIIQAKKKGIWVELVTNLIPGVNDSHEEIKEMAEWIASELGAEVPWHLTRFFPAHQWNHLPATSIKKMKQAWEIARSRGLKFVYLGNLPGDKRENTYCPCCGTLLIERRIFGVLKLNLSREGICPSCGKKIPGHFQWAKARVCYDQPIF